MSQSQDQGEHLEDDKYDNLHQICNTTAIIGKFQGSTFYPDRNASMREFADAQTDRSNGWLTKDLDQALQAWPQHEQTTKENCENRNEILPKHGIANVDHAYVEGSQKRYRAPDPQREHSVTRSVVEKTLDKYPEGDSGETEDRDRQQGSS